MEASEHSEVVEGRPPTAQDLTTAAGVLRANDEPSEADSCDVVAGILERLVPMVEALETGDTTAAIQMLVAEGNMFAPKPVE